MSQVYIEYNFTVTPFQPGTEILIVELGLAGFESFVEYETGVQAYIQKEAWQDDILEGIQILSSSEFEISFERKYIEQKNVKQNKFFKIIRELDNEKGNKLLTIHVG